MISPILTFASLAFIPVFIITILPVNKIIRKKYSKIKRAYAKIYGVIEFKLSNLTEIIAKKKILKESKHLNNRIKIYNNLSLNYEKFSMKLNGLISIISDIAPYSVLLLATYLIIQGRFEIGTFLAFSMLMPRLFGPVKGLVSKELELQTLSVTSERVFSILENKKD